MGDSAARLSRRAFVRRCAAAVLAVPFVGVLADRATAAPGALPGVPVRPRSDWAAGLPAGRVESERPEDVRFLIVHHTASPNGYAAGEVPSLIRGFHGFHTGPEKGWPDVAYNFFVDRYGTVWEGRAGSLDGPVKPDATGGSQGFAQICCFIGDHTAEAPTADAQRSMTLLLAGLAQRYGIDPGGSTTFVSRGSNKWPAGTSVTTTTIAGHRDMSLTTCPGDAAYPIVRNAFPADVAAVLAARATPTPTPSSPAAPASTSAPASPSRGSTSPSTSPSTGTPAAESTATAAAADDGEGVDGTTMALIGAGAVATGAAAVLARHLRGGRPPADGA